MSAENLDANLTNYTGQDVVGAGKYVVTLEYKWGMDNPASAPYFDGWRSRWSEGQLTQAQMLIESESYARGQIAQAISAIRQKEMDGDAVLVSDCTSITWGDFTQGGYHFRVPLIVEFQVELHSIVNVVILIATIIGLFVAAALFPSPFRTAFRTAGDLVGSFFEGTISALKQPLLIVGAGLLALGGLWIWLRK